MDLAQHRWFVRWFFWCCRVEDRFCSSKRRLDRGYSRTERYFDGTNLCHFFRTLLFGSLIFGLTVALYAYLFFVVVILPLLLFRTVAVATIVLVILGILAGAAGFVAILVFGVPWVVQWLNRWGTRWAQANPRPDNQEPGFFRLAYGYYRGLKQQICPLIAFKGDPVHDSD
jgi:hypothetical protein